MMITIVKKNSAGKLLSAGILFVLSVVICIFAVSCMSSSVENMQETDTTADITASNEEQETSRLSWPDNVADMDYEGAVFNILYPTWGTYNQFFFAEEVNGDVMNDAIYQRKLNVEGKFNIKIESVAHGYIDSIAPNLQKSVHAGSDDYQLVLTHCIQGLTTISNGLGANWNRVPYVDFEKPWWNQKMNEELAVNGILLTAVSDYIVFDPNVIYFNKKMVDDLSLQNPYDLVTENRWTWDKLTEMAQAASMDLNGDGKFTKDDQFGLVTHVGWMIDSAVQGSDIFLTVKDEDGGRVCNLQNNERFGRLVETIHNLYYTGSQTFLGTWDANNLNTTYESQVPMGSGRALFHIDPLNAGIRYRTYEIDFGILPYPKLDEQQSEYLSFSWNGFMVVPQTANLEYVGAVTEMLAQESFRYVVPAYYDILLTSKVSRDEESVAMLDIIFKGACYDFGLDFGEFNALSMPLSNILATKNANYVSYVDKNINSYQKQLEKVYNNIMENYGE